MIINRLLPPIIFNGRRYLAFLQNQIEIAINALEEDTSFLFQQDWALSHNSRITNYLNNESESE